MCLGAIYWARLKQIYFAGTAADAAKAGFDDSFIYREFTKELPQRSIPMAQMMSDEALTPFQAWREQSNKVRY